jgi:hypothetical protein
MSLLAAALARAREGASCSLGEGAAGRLESQKLQVRTLDGSTAPHCEHSFVTGAFCAADAPTPVRREPQQHTTNPNGQADFGEVMFPICPEGAAFFSREIRPEYSAFFRVRFARFVHQRCRPHAFPRPDLADPGTGGVSGALNRRLQTAEFRGSTGPFDRAKDAQSLGWAYMLFQQSEKTCAAVRAAARVHHGSFPCLRVGQTRIPEGSSRAL